MENFDVQNNVNPTLVRGALLYYNGILFKVADMNNEIILISNPETDSVEIKDDEWKPVDLDDEWLSKFNLQVGSKIHNKNTDQDWIIKTTGTHFYITAVVPPPYRDNPVIGLKFVHELQAWFYRLTKQDLIHF